jgi:hypothetical protein
MSWSASPARAFGGVGTSRSHSIYTAPSHAYCAYALHVPGPFFSPFSFPENIRNKKKVFMKLPKTKLSLQDRDNLTLYSINKTFHHVPTPEISLKNNYSSTKQSIL